MMQPLSVLLFICCLSHNLFGMSQWCAVGNPSVFQIQRTELSNVDYCAFLNACARDSDTYQLWNPLMESHFWGGILRTKDNKGYHYFVKPGYEKYPATCMTWMSAARYCNWVAYGQPNTGKSELGTTEGTDQFGVYDTRTWQDASFIQSKCPVKRNTNQSYFLPTVEEWRLAAGELENPTQEQANFYDGKWALPVPHLANIDSCAQFPSPSGTLNQYGNVAEWVETRRGNFFLALGGSLIRGRYSLASDFTEGDEANKAISSFGIRLASALNPKILPRPRIEKKEIERVGSQTLREWCYIGDVGNPRDPLYRKGRVLYSFELKCHALTNEEYCRFLNVVAKESDPYGLFNSDMQNGILGGIVRLDGGGGYVCKSGWEHRPVVYVGFHDIMRYCNYLHYGKTEGTDTEGAYDTRFCEKILSGEMSAPPSYGRRNKEAKYWIPSDDEWYKAAYYDPTRTCRRKYWDYPCRTSNRPSNQSTDPHSCNYLKEGVYLGLGAPYYLAEVQDYPNSDTYYGVRQMAGNVWEWVEPNNPHRCLNLRGTSFGYTEFGMGVWNCDEAGYKDELNVFGARIARRAERVKVTSVPIREKFLEKMSDLGPRRTLLYFSLCLVVVGLVGISCGFLLGRRENEDNSARLSVVVRRQVSA